MGCAPIINQRVLPLAFPSVIRVYDVGVRWRGGVDTCLSGWAGGPFIHTTYRLAIWMHAYPPPPLPYSTHMLGAQRHTHQTHHIHTHANPYTPLSFHSQYINLHFMTNICTLF